MIRFLVQLIESRRMVRRARFAVAHLRVEAARAEKGGDKSLGRYLSAVADMIERAP